MSRGLGRLQTYALAALRANPSGVHVADVARSYYGGRPSPSQYEAMRRALASLEARGLAELCLAQRVSPPWYVSVGSVAACNRPNTYTAPDAEAAS